jgi:hypothetical protein
LAALDDVKSDKMELVDSKLTKPNFFQMPARIFVELGMLQGCSSKKLVATVELQAKEG